jgi:DME family drug/metabolite transporter
MRTLIATPILLALCWHVVGREMFNVRGRDLIVMVLAGTCLVLSQAAYFAAIRYGGITITTLLTLCLSPLVVVLFSVLLKLETPTKRIVLALIFALMGCLLLVGINPQTSNYENFTLGIVFSLIAAVFYAFMLICGRFLAVDYHPLQVTAIAFCAGTVVLLVINLMGHIVIVQTTQGWGLVLYLALVPTAFAYWLFQVGLRTTSATTASIVIMLDPVVSGVLAWMLFGETLTATGLIGTVLLLGSLFLLSVRAK